MKLFACADFSLKSLLNPKRHSRRLKSIFSPAKRIRTIYSRPFEYLHYASCFLPLHACSICLTGSPLWHSSWVNFAIDIFAIWILTASCSQVYCIPNDKNPPVFFWSPGYNYTSGNLGTWLMRQCYILIICAAFIIQTYGDSGGYGSSLIAFAKSFIQFPKCAINS